MNDGPRTVLGLILALLSITLQQVACVVSILAGLAAFAATVPVIVDRWRHLLPERVTRYFPPAKSA